VDHAVQLLQKMDEATKGGRFSQEDHFLSLFMSMLWKVENYQGV